MYIWNIIEIKMTIVNLVIVACNKCTMYVCVCMNNRTIYHVLMYGCILSFISSDTLKNKIKRFGNTTII